MRYMLAMLLALGMGVATVVPPAMAQIVNQYGNTVVPLDIGGGDHEVCDVDGVARSCLQPAPVTLNPPSGPGAVAGAPAPTPVFTDHEGRND